MSVPAMTWAFKIPPHEMPDRPKGALVALADHANDHSGEDWTCFPGFDRLLLFTSQKERTLERSLQWLSDEGWITRDQRRNADGELTVRHYTLHRDAETRSRLRAERASAKADPEGCAREIDQASPPATLAGGEMASPPAKNPPHHPPKQGSPPANLAGGYIEEPPREPELTPTERAGEGARDPFGAFIGAYPLDGLDSTSLPAARTAFEAAAAEAGDPWLIVQAAEDWARDRERKPKTYAAPSANVWFERRSWEPRVRRMAAKVEPPAAAIPAFIGPPEAFAAVAGLLGEDGARSWLATAAWAEAGRVLTVGGPAFDRLRTVGAAQALAGLNITLQRRAA
ncbi:MAG: hypothetical protein Q8L23_15850 [Caulobacter sp.]|nr:hypothetical protein [Caulobacter sp.]